MHKYYVSIEASVEQSAREPKRLCTQTLEYKYPVPVTTLKRDLIKTIPARYTSFTDFCLLSIEEDDS